MDSIFSQLIEEMKRAADAGGKLWRFSFTVKLLHIKSFYQISNAAMNAILRLWNLQYPDSDVPKTYDEALAIIADWVLGMIPSMCAQIIVCCLGSNMPSMTTAQSAMRRGG
jgi:hypothetical protein